jgi:DNA-binding response OmpR family regulator
MPLRCLLLCSNENITRVLTSILKELEVGCDTSTTTADALRRVRMTRYDALILDWEDECPATALVQAVRDTPLNQGLLTVAILDHSQEGLSAFDRGANFALYKPISDQRARASLVAAVNLMQRERRQGARLRVHISTAISYADIENAKVTLLDLSQGGTALQSERKLPANDKLYFHFGLPGQNTLVRLSGQVVWQDSAGRAGVRFVDVPQASRRYLEDWLKKRLGEGEPQTPSKLPQGAAESQLSGSLMAGSRPRSARASSSDRRGGARLSCELGAQVYRDGGQVPHWCKVSDLSRGGCYVEMTSTFPAGTPVKVVIRNQDQKLELQGRVQVVHAAFGMGIEFSLRTAAEKEKLSCLVEMLYPAKPEKSGSRTESKTQSPARGNAAGSDH